MLKKIGTAFADRISRWLPDSLVFAFVLTIVAAIMALVFTSTKPLELISHWYNGFWTHAGVCHANGINRRFGLFHRYFTTGCQRF